MEADEEWEEQKNLMNVRWITLFPASFSVSEAFSTSHTHVHTSRTSGWLGFLENESSWPEMRTYMLATRSPSLKTHCPWGIKTSSKCWLTKTSTPDGSSSGKTLSKSALSMVWWTPKRNPCQIVMGWLRWQQNARVWENQRWESQFGLFHLMNRQKLTLGKLSTTFCPGISPLLNCCKVLSPTIRINDWK